MSAIDNKKALERGFKKMERILEERISVAFEKVAVELLVDAWNTFANDKVGLTGNAINGIAGGLYVNGVLKKVFTYDVEGHGERERHKMVQPGALKGNYFLDWETGELVTKVSDYKGSEYEFVPTNTNTTARSLALGFLKNEYKGGGARSTKKGWEVVIVSGAPYSEFLVNVRKLNILTNTMQIAEGRMRYHLTKALR